MRDRVVFQIEPHVRGLARPHHHPLAQVPGLLGAGQQTGLLLGEGLAHRQALVLGPGARAGMGLAPGARLRVQVVDVSEVAGGEEVLADVPDAALHAALLVAAGDARRPRLVTVMGGEGQQLRVEPDGLAHALEHGALQVVAQDDPRHPAPGGERQDVAAQEAVHAGVQAEVHEQVARVAEHHDEGHQRAPGPAHRVVAEVGPVDLGLFARQGAQAQVGLGGWARAATGDAVAEVAGAADIAALTDHGVQTAGRERGVLGQGLADERQIGVHAARARGDGRGCGARLLEYPPHGPMVHLQLPSDGAHEPVLDLEQAQDLGAQLRGYGHG